MVERYMFADIINIILDIILDIDLDIILIKID